MDSIKREVVTAQTANWRIVITLLGIALAIFMAALEATVVGTAMPTVIATLGGIEIYSWVFAAYILASTIMTPIWGKMADLLGRRPALFGGLACFIIGSALSGAAQSMLQLIIFRALQGLGAGALFPVGMTIVADLLSLERRAKMIGLFSGMWGVAGLIGPLAGGYLTDYLHWRWVFYINLPFGLLAWAMVWAAYPERTYRRANISLDYAGAITLSAFLTLLLLLLEKIGQIPLGGNIALSAGLLALLIIFIKIEQRSGEPLVPLELFHARMVTAVTLHGLFAGMALFGTMAFLPLFVQAVIGTTATQAGTILTPYILAWVIGAPLGGRLILRIGYRPVVIAGTALIIVGAVLLAQVSIETVRIELVWAGIMMGLGGGLSIASLMIGAQHSVPRHQLGVVTSTVQFSRSIGAAIGTGAMGALMGWRLDRLLAGGSRELAPLASTHRDITAIVRQATRAALSPEATMFLRQSLAVSLRLAFTFVLAAAIVAAIISLIIPGGSAHDLKHPDHH